MGLHLGWTLHGSGSGGRVGIFVGGHAERRSQWLQGWLTLKQPLQRWPGPTPG